MLVVIVRERDGTKAKVASFANEQLPEATDMLRSLLIHNKNVLRAVIYLDDTDMKEPKLLKIAKRGITGRILIK